MSLRTPADAAPFVGAVVLAASLGIAISQVSAAAGSVVINEIMYNPVDGSDAEYIELFNPGDDQFDLTGVTWGGVVGTFGSGSLGSGEYLVVSPSAATTAAVYGVTPALEYEGNLSNGGETLSLFASDGAVLDTLTYDDNDPWPGAADGSGPSLELLDPNSDNADPVNWLASIAPTPGAPNSQSSTDPRVISAAANPAWPNETEPITITADVANVSAATLVYREMFGSEVSIAMAPAGPNIYTSTLPPQEAGTLIRYRIDTPEGATLPSSNSSSGYLGFTVRKPVTTGLPTIEWFLSDNDFAALDSPESRLRPGEVFFDTVVAYEGSVFDGAAVRVRGGAARQTIPKVGLNFDLPDGQLLNAPLLFPYPVDEFALASDGALTRAQLAWDVAIGAGFPDYQTRFVRVQRNGEFHAQYRMKEKLDGKWRSAHDLNDGQFFKAEGGFRRSALASGGWDKKDPDDGDLSTIDALDDLIKNSPTEAQLWDLLDIPNMVNYWALSSAVRHQDQDGNNQYMYLDDAETGLWSAYPWDLDRTFGRGGGPACINDPMIDLSCLGNPLYDALRQSSTFQSMYFRRLRTILDGPMAAPLLEDRYQEIRDSLEADAAEELAAWGVDPSLGDDQGLVADLAARRQLIEAQSELPASSVGTPNLVISEIHYRSGPVGAEFIEVHNQTTEWVDLSGWELPGVNLVFPGGTVVSPGGFVVATENIPEFRTLWNPGSDYLVVRFAGGLAAGGEQLQLIAADFAIVDDVTYDDVPPWPDIPSDGSASLSVTSLTGDNSTAAGWTADAPSPGS